MIKIIKVKRNGDEEMGKYTYEVEYTCKSCGNKFILEYTSDEEPSVEIQRESKRWFLFCEGKCLKCRGIDVEIYPELIMEQLVLF